MRHARTLAFGLATLLAAGCSADSVSGPSAPARPAYDGIGMIGGGRTTTSGIGMIGGGRSGDSGTGSDSTSTASTGTK